MRTHPLPLAALLLLLPMTMGRAAAAADGTPGADPGSAVTEKDAAGQPGEGAASGEGPAPAPAEPLVAPVMPVTVVTPAGVVDEDGGATAPRPARERPRSVSLGKHGLIELGQAPSPASRWRGFPISLSLRDAPLPEVLRSFARLTGVNLVLDPRVQGEVTVELRDVPWDQALYVILKTHGLGAEIDGRVWLVQP